MKNPLLQQILRQVLQQLNQLHQPLRFKRHPQQILQQILRQVLLQQLNSPATTQTSPITNPSSTNKPGETVKPEQGTSEVSQSVEESSETPTTSGANGNYVCVGLFVLLLQKIIFFE